MSAATRLPSWLTPPPVDVAVEITSARVTVAQVTGARGAMAVSACGSEPLPPEAVTPNFTGPNVLLKQTVLDATRGSFERAGLKLPKRIALVIPDSAARVSLVPLEQVPDKAADLEQIIRFHLKKMTPFPIDEAEVGYAPAFMEGSLTTFAAVVTRRDVLAEYEGVASALGMQAGLVELSSFNLINAVTLSPAAPSGDWLLVSLSAEATTIAIVRGAKLMFYRQRAAADNEPLSALIHQTAMYHEDRMAGGAFSRVVLCGAAAGEGGANRVRQDLSARLGLPAAGIETRATPAVRDRIAAIPEMADALSAPVGLLLREQQVA